MTAPILDRVFPPDLCNDEVGAAYQRKERYWWVTGGPSHTHREAPRRAVWPLVMDDEGEVA